jgi:Ca2+-binding RTX toxin-like protein
VTLAGHENEPDMKFYLADESGDGKIDIATEVELVGVDSVSGEPVENVTATYTLDWDILSQSPSVDFVTVWSSYGDDFLFGELSGSVATLSGTAPFDWDAYSAAYEGDTGNNAIDVSGSSDAFAIDAYAGNDTIVGSSKGDLIFGDEGNDTMTGGGGDDIFVFDTDFSDTDIDVITDFSAANMGQDMIVLEGSEVFDADGYGFIFESGTISGTSFTQGSDVSDTDAAIKFVDTTSTSQMILLQGVDASKLVFADIEDSVAIWLHNV